MRMVKIPRKQRDKYELIITKNKNFFIDLKKNKVYLLEK